MTKKKVRKDLTVRHSVSVYGIGADPVPTAIQYGTLMLPLAEI